MLLVSFCTRIWRAAGTAAKIKYQLCARGKMTLASHPFCLLPKSNFLFISNYCSSVHCPTQAEVPLWGGIINSGF